MPPWCRCAPARGPRSRCLRARTRLIAIPLRVHPMVSLIQRLQATLGKAQPCGAHGSGLPDRKRQAADRKEIRRRREGQVEIEAAFHRVVFASIESPALFGVRRNGTDDAPGAEPPGELGVTSPPGRIAGDLILEPTRHRAFGEHGRAGQLPERRVEDEPGGFMPRAVQPAPEHHLGLRRSLGHVSRPRRGLRPWPRCSARSRRACCASRRRGDGAPSPRDAPPAE